MLPNSPQVKAVVLGKDGVIEGAQKGSIVVDMSSIAPLVAREVSTALTQKGIRMLDAPVSGGQPKAIDGSLSIMVGGAQADFDEILPIFKAMGSSAVLTGGVGAGNVTKLANQIIVAINIAAVSEALVMATKAGATHDGPEIQSRFPHQPAYQGPGKRTGNQPRNRRAAAVVGCRDGDHAGTQS
jgi:2-hydroxy-3-oxopropionate reductase